MHFVNSSIFWEEENSFGSIPRTSHLVSSFNFHISETYYFLLTEVLYTRKSIIASRCRWQNNITITFPSECSTLAFIEMLIHQSSIVSTVICVKIIIFIICLPKILPVLLAYCQKGLRTFDTFCLWKGVSIRGNLSWIQLPHLHLFRVLGEYLCCLF